MFERIHDRIFKNQEVVHMQPIFEGQILRHAPDLGCSTCARNHDKQLTFEGRILQSAPELRCKFAIAMPRISFPIDEPRTIDDIWEMNIRLAVGVC